MTLATTARILFKTIWYGFMTLVGLVAAIVVLSLLVDICVFISKMLSGTYGWKDVNWALLILLYFFFGPMPHTVWGWFVKKK